MRRKCMTPKWIEEVVRNISEKEHDIFEAGRVKSMYSKMFWRLLSELRTHEKKEKFQLNSQIEVTMPPSSITVYLSCCINILASTIWLFLTGKNHEHPRSNSQKHTFCSKNKFLFVIN